MKRLWLGIAILAVLLGVSIGVQMAMDRLHSPISEDLELAAQASLEEDWERARFLYDRACAAWEDHHRVIASVADHSPMDELDMLLSEISVFSQEEEAVHFAATCRSAAQMAQAMAEAHRFTWWNLL